MEPMLKITSVFASSALREILSALTARLLSRGMHLQGSDTGVVNQTAPHPAAPLDNDSADHSGNGWDAELDDLVVRAGKSLNTLEENLAERRDHDDGKDQDTHWLKPIPLQLVCIIRR